MRASKMKSPNVQFFATSRSLKNFNPIGSQREPFYHHRSATQFSVFSHRNSRSLDKEQKEIQRIRREKLDKVKHNKELNQKIFQSRIDKIIRRSVKKEQYARKLNQDN